MNEQLVGLAINELPILINGLLTLFQKNHPDEPAPTNEEVIAAFQAAVESSIAKDELWLRSHPEDAPPDA